MNEQPINFFDPKLSRLIGDCDEYNWFRNKSLAEYWGKAQLENDGFTPGGTYHIEQLFGVYFVFCKNPNLVGD